MNDVPFSLIRCFNEHQHAIQFISGELRFGLLQVYHNIEGARQDVQEGKVRFQWNLKAPNYTFNAAGKLVYSGMSDKNIQFHGESINPHYILCTSHPETDRVHLLNSFGPFQVHIHNPVELLNRINSVWSGHPWASGKGWICPVIYNKDTIREADPFLISPPEYDYSQKSPSFAKDMEYRYVLCCPVPARDEVTPNLFLNVSDCGDICSLEIVKRHPAAGAHR